MIWSPLHPHQDAAAGAPGHVRRSPPRPRRLPARDGIVCAHTEETQAAGR